MASERTTGVPYVGSKQREQLHVLSADTTARPSGGAPAKPMFPTHDSAVTVGDGSYATTTDEVVEPALDNGPAAAPGASQPGRLEIQLLHRRLSRLTPAESDAVRMARAADVWPTRA